MFRTIDYPPKRQYSFVHGKINADIDAHAETIPNQYQNSRDLINSVHESTHYINSTLRNKYSPLNGYYLLDNRAALLNPIPNLTIRDVQKAVPAELHGMSFSLYLIQSQRDWNSNILYLCDEQSAYLNGAKCGAELNLDINSELLQSIEFCLYLAVITELSHSEEVLSFQKYQLEQSLNLQSKKPSRAVVIYLQKWAGNSTYKKYLQSSLEGYGNADFL